MRAGRVGRPRLPDGAKTDGTANGTEYLVDVNLRERTPLTSLIFYRKITI